MQVGDNWSGHITNYVCTATDDDQVVASYTFKSFKHEEMMPSIVRVCKKNVKNRKFP
jgi:hypothetical protein